MNRIGERLRHADPLAHEPPPDDAARSQARDAAMRTAGATTSSKEREPLPSRALVAAVLATAVVAMAVVPWSRLWTAVDAPAYAAVRFEMRLAEEAPAPGLREAPVGTEPRIVYVHDRAVVTNDDVTSARVVAGSPPGRYGVEIHLSPAAAERLREATRQHIGRPLALLIDGLVVLAPTVRSEIAEVGLLSGDYDRATAERIAGGVMAR